MYFLVQRWSSAFCSLNDLFVRLAQWTVLALFFVAATGTASCRAPEPYIEVVLNTDLPKSVSVTFTIRVIRVNQRIPDASALMDAADATGDDGLDGAMGMDGARDGGLDGARDARSDVPSDIPTRDVLSDSGVRSDVLSDASTATMDVADSGAGVELRISSSVPSQEWRRNGTDAGITLPASFVLRQPLMEREPLLVEVSASSSSSTDPYYPSMSWKQYAVVTPSIDGPTVVRMMMSYRCASQVRGCGADGTESCSVEDFCRARGLTCGEDGQCLDPAAVLTYARNAPSITVPDGGCDPGRCGPWCPPCPGGQSCGFSGTCIRTAASPCIDVDGDGYGEGPNCFGRDCNDQNRLVFPGASERCDRLDNDCNMQVDELGVCGPFTNLTCAGATPINLMATREVTLYADNSQGMPILGPMCRFAGSSGGDGKELWYAITYPGSEELDVYAARDQIQRPDSVLLLFSSCDPSPATLLGCNDDIASPSDYSSRVVVRPSIGAPAAPRTVYAALDSFGASSGGIFRLQIRRRPSMPTSTCAAPYDVEIGGTIAGTIGSTDAQQLACAMGARAPEEAFRVQTTIETVTVQGSTPTRMPVLLYTSRMGCATDSMDPCVSSDGTTFTLSVPEASQRTVLLEGPRGTPYMLNFSTTANGI